MVLGTSAYKNGTWETMFAFSDKGICYCSARVTRPASRAVTRSTPPGAERIAARAVLGGLGWGHGQVTARSPQLSGRQRLSCLLVSPICIPWLSATLTVYKFLLKSFKSC
jgi:hypothetical protein